jgi:hypothetical protein
MANYVGTLAQITIATIRIGGRSFDELVRHTWTTVMEASRHSRHDAAKRLVMDELIEHERGLRLDYVPLFNNLIPESWSGLSGASGSSPGRSTSRSPGPSCGGARCQSAAWARNCRSGSA